MKCAPSKKKEGKKKPWETCPNVWVRLGVKEESAERTMARNGKLIESKNPRLKSKTIQRSNIDLWRRLLCWSGLWQPRIVPI